MKQHSDSLALNRRTVADSLFLSIRRDIEEMRLLPGTKISEAEIAKRYDVSRQPVREAFIRLDNLSLLEIRPQRATTVRRISRSAIEQARFVRVAVEIEVARRACQQIGSADIDAMNAQLEQQAECLDENNISKFHELDREFHQGICVVAECAFAMEVLNDCKAKVDRLCILSLSNKADFQAVYDDHVLIARYLVSRDEEKLIMAIRKHLSRLDATIDYVQTHHTSYFDE